MSVKCLRRHPRGLDRLVFGSGALRAFPCHRIADFNPEPGRYNTVPQRLGVPARTYLLSSFLAPPHVPTRET
jgi:hypothetical protein